MGFGSIMRSAFHLITGVSDGKSNPNFVPFSQRNNTPDQLRAREVYLREKYLWKGKSGWGAGGSATTFKTEAEALAEAERLESEQERLN